MSGAAQRSYASGAAELPLRGDTIGQALAATVAAHPRGLALVARHQGIRQTWTELAGSVDDTARALLALGLDRGDRLGVWAPTCAEWTWLQLASARLGVIVVNVNPGYRAAELAFALGHAGVKVLAMPARFRTSDYGALLAEARPGLAALDRVVLLGEEPLDGPGLLGWAEFMAAGREVADGAVEALECRLDPDDPINIQYTSGTTGSPKGATLTHHNILNNAVVAAAVTRYTPGDRVCIPVPMYHCFGMGIGNLGCVVSGSTMVYPAAVFDPLATLEAVAEEGCTSLYGVPTMFIAELDHPRFAEFDLGTLRTGMMGGAPCPVEVMKRVIADMGCAEVCIIYGMTETSPVTFMTRHDDSVERRVSTVGTALPHTEAKVVDPASGATVARGEPGEVCTRGYAVMRGYWDNPAATAEAIDQAGWMHTGDLGVMDDMGYLNIVGRIKDIVIRGGENLFPREIEEVLFEHPAVASAQVIGVPDARMGEELMAWVVLRAGAEASAADLQDFCRSRLAHFKVPRYVKFTDGFPMTVTGKVQKFRMREMAIDELDLHAAAAIRTA